MAKKTADIVTLGDNDKLTVQKSRALLGLSKSKLSLQEFKILDTYLARIDSHKPERRSVLFEKGELENILGVQRINSSDLKNNLKHLMSNIVEIPDSDEKKGFKLITLFEEAVAKQDDDGFWTVRLACTKNAMKYMFNIENLGYYRYKLRCIMPLKSRYSYLMFLYLESNRRIHREWEVKIDTLKELLNCDSDDYAKEFKYFNRDILKRVQTELIEKTECQYTYEPVKKGRKIVAVRFNLKSLSAQIEDIINTPDTSSNDVIVEEVELWHTALKDFNLTEDQLNVIDSILMTVPTSKMPNSPACEDSEDLMKYHYIDQYVKLIKNRDSVKPISNKYAYLVKILRQDALSK